MQLLRQSLITWKQINWVNEPFTIAYAIGVSQDNAIGEHPSRLFIVKNAVYQRYRIKIYRLNCRKTLNSVKRPHRLNQTPPFIKQRVLIARDLRNAKPIPLIRLLNLPGITHDLPAKNKPKPCWMVELIIGCRSISMLAALNTLFYIYCMHAFSIKRCVMKDY